MRVESDCKQQVSLANYERNSFDRGRSIAIVCLWRVVGRLLPFVPLSRLRGYVLKLFGAKIRAGVILQNRLRVRYPWRLTIGKNSWVGENCWIDNWAPVVIGENACISQSVYLCTGNHDWTDPSFAIAPKPIVIGDSAWVGARATVGPGVVLEAGSVAVMGSVVTRNVPQWEIHAGNPATFVKVRRLSRAPANQKLKHRVVVVGPACSRGGITSVITAHSKMEMWRLFDCQQLNTFTDRGILSKALTALRAYVSAPVLFRQCSIVHVHLAGRSSMIRKFPLLILAKLMQKRVVVHVHAPSTAALTGSRPKWLFAAVCQLADRVIALSPWWEQELRALGTPTPISVIPNPVAIPERSTDSPSQHIQPSPRVLFVGKLEPRKGYRDLIRAAALVLESIPETEFLLVGHGECEEARSLADSLGIEKAVKLTGWQPGETLANFYRTATVFCLPSFDEGVPMSVLEAMSWGLPVVTTPVGGIPDFIAHRVNGLFVNPGDVRELASSILTLLRQSQAERDQLGCAARQTVLHHCELEQVSAKLTELYECLLDRELLACKPHTRLKL